MITRELFGVAFQNDPAFEHAGQSRRDFQRPIEFLFHQNNRRSSRDDRAQRFIDLLDGDGCQPKGYLVEKQQPRIGHQSAADRGCLLLAARQITALALQTVS